MTEKIEETKPKTTQKDPKLGWGFFLYILKFI